MKLVQTVISDNCVQLKDKYWACSQDCIFRRAFSPLLMKHESLNTCNRCFAFFQDIKAQPEFDVLVLVSRPRHQDLWSQDRDQDQDLFFQDRDQDQDLRIRSRDGLETKTCLETSHPCNEVNENVSSCSLRGPSLPYRLTLSLYYGTVQLFNAAVYVLALTSLIAFIKRAVLRLG